ncbi:MAG: hypothetical protein AAGB32_05625, partial [Pseudomonadota bacterium]
MTIPDLRLGNEFWCHTHTPEFGFWGEMRHMVREDMTLGEAIESTRQNWRFGGNFQDSLPASHETVHKVAEICAVYNPKLRCLLPQLDERDGLKPFAYNGFANVEKLVIDYEYNMLDRHRFANLEAAKDSFLLSAISSLDKGYIMLPTETYLWADSYENQDEYRNLFEFKRVHNFDTGKLTKHTSANATRSRVKSRCESVKREILEETEPFSIDIYEA